MPNEKWVKVFISEIGINARGLVGVPLPDGWELNTASVTSIMIRYGSSEYDTIQQLAPNLWIAFWQDDKGKPVPDGWMNHCYIIHALEMAN